MDYKDQIDMLWQQIETLKDTLQETQRDLGQLDRILTREITEIESRIYDLERNRK